MLVSLAVGRARKKIADLVNALDGTFTDHHAWMCRHYLDQIDHLDRLIVRMDERIAALTKDRDDDLKQPRHPARRGPPGRRAAEVILAETGGDMAQFATGHLASWIGVCPGMNESAGSTRLERPATATPTSSASSASRRLRRCETRTPTTGSTTGASPPAAAARRHSSQ
ncbi:transposase [Micromonospora sp. NPDC048999]|uniref:transposase n=1 Tax=Micromonospora sp. NPDC048999 TaxID=3155391 RepID=UPI0033FF7878